MIDLGESGEVRTDVDVLVFELGGVLFGADASQVLRIERVDATPGKRYPLGVVSSGGRGLVFRTGTGEGLVRVDGVQGIRQAPIGSLRRLPPAATPRPYAIGVWLEADRAMLLVDLIELLNAEKSQGGIESHAHRSAE